ncbi:MAG: TolB family protein [Omnitrophica WOR_2 bacterium]
MSAIPEPSFESATARLEHEPQRIGGLSTRLTRGGISVLLSLDFLVVALIAWPILIARVRLPAHAAVPLTATPSLFPSDSPEPSTTPAPALTGTSTTTPTSTPAPPYPQQPASFGSDWIILSMAEGTHFHIFAYMPDAVPMTRLTSGQWDDITPALSPDGTRLAFASNRNGYWDLYLLDLVSGETTRLTDSLEYDAAPSWSPDGLWLAYETLNPGDGNLNIYIRPAANDAPPIRLTANAATNFAPSWSPQGRKIAYVSTESGEPNIWIADLDKTGADRFRDLSNTPGALEDHPVWSPDGSALAWSMVENGLHSLVIWKNDLPGQTELAGNGDWPAWSPDGTRLLSTYLEPNRTYLAAYALDASGILLPPYALPGEVDGLLWTKAKLAYPFIKVFSESARMTPAPLWMPVLTPEANLPAGRRQLAPLKDVQVPHALLNDMVDESFQALRTEVAARIGWDFLATLENAYVPLTASLDPGLGADWLYTGRGIDITTLPINAGWMAVVREDFEAQTCWRIYLRSRYQDGSSGKPLHDQPWDINSRFDSDPVAYEQGGKLSEAVPPGYWLDFTRLARQYGWDRLPALIDWRYSYPSTRLSEFAFSDGLDWRSAMLELYPPEALITPTPLVPPTRTPSPTPFWYETSTPTVTPTPRPTLTPLSPALATVEASTNIPAPSATFTTTPTAASTKTRKPASTQTPTSTPLWTTTPVPRP